VDCKDMARRSVEAVKKGELRLIPDTHNATWFHWLENIQDWCVSRQLWWGHRIPAYFAQVKGQPEANMDTDHDRWFVARTEADALRDAAKALNVSEDQIELTQDPDVLDTWYSSGLFPFSTLGWPEKTPDVAQYYPGALLETGYDILFFWVARMVMMGLSLTDKLPFTDVYLHTIVRDKHGEKMSKSKGNVIDPLWVVQGATLESLHTSLDKSNIDPKEVKKAKVSQSKEYPNGIAPCGSDGLRYCLLHETSMGADVNLDINTTFAYRAFCNKIWQATRFVMPHLQGYTPKPTPMEGLLNKDRPLCIRYILNELNIAIGTCDHALETYVFREAAQAGTLFFQDQFCGVFVEYIKRVVGDANHPDRECAQETLYTCLETSFRLLHPMMPFITEDLWQRLPKRSSEKAVSVMLASYPTPVAEWKDEAASKDMGNVLAVAKAMRSTKDQYRIAPKVLPKCFIRSNADNKAIMESHIADLQAIAKVGDIGMMDLSADAPAGSVVTPVNESLDICTVLAGAVDTAAEIAKLEKAIATKTSAKDKLSKTVADEASYAKRPAHLKQQDAEKLVSFTKELEQLAKDVESFKALEAQANGGYPKA